MELIPLGDYEQLLRSLPQAWGAGTVIHGSRVLDDLMTGIEQHRDTATEGYWGRLGARSAALGCVPWLTDFPVADALASLGQCCIVVDKQQPDYGAVRRLADNGHSLVSMYLDGFDLLTRRQQDGSTPVIVPQSPLPEPMELGPVRVVGWTKDPTGQPRPMLHSKMLVLGVTTYWEDDEDFYQDIAKFEPKVTWMGSANWTMQARHHIEHGLWSRDPVLVQQNYEYLLSLVRFSEPRGAATIGPEPELMSAMFDDDAFREYVADMEPRDDEDDPDG